MADDAAVTTTAAVSPATSSRPGSGAPPEGLDFAPLDPRALLVYLGALGLVHLLFVLAGRRTDQVLLPAAGMLGGIGLLLMQRLPQGLVTQSFFGTELMLAQVQLVQRFVRSGLWRVRETAGQPHQAQGERG